MSWIYITAAAVLSLIVCWYGFNFVLMLWEKQYLAGDVDRVDEPYPYAPSTYWLATRENARLAGLICVGTFATKRCTSKVKGLESVWVTPDRTIVAGIVGGSFAGIPFRKTALRSRLSDGRLLESTDEVTPKDPSGLVHNTVLLHAGIAELLAFHRRRLEQAGALPVSFVRPDVHQEMEEIEIERGRRLVAMGLARWVDDRQTIIRATMRGAWRTVYLSNLQQWRDIQGQRERMSVPRAGT